MIEGQSDISALFAQDPLHLTKTDRTAIITYFRENREKFLSGVKVEKAPKLKSSGPLPDIDLDIEL